MSCLVRRIRILFFCYFYFTHCTENNIDDRCIKKTVSYWILRNYKADKREHKEQKLTRNLNLKFNIYFNNVAARILKIIYLKHKKKQLLITMLNYNLIIKSRTHKKNGNGGNKKEK